MYGFYMGCHFSVKHITVSVKLAIHVNTKSPFIVFGLCLKVILHILNVFLFLININVFRHTAPSRGEFFKMGSRP